MSLPEPGEEEALAAKLAFADDVGEEGEEEQAPAPKENGGSSSPQHNGSADQQDFDDVRLRDSNPAREDEKHTRCGNEFSHKSPHHSVRSPRAARRSDSAGVSPRSLSLLFRASESLQLRRNYRRRQQAAGVPVGNNDGGERAFKENKRSGVGDSEYRTDQKSAPRGKTKKCSDFFMRNT